MASFSAACRQVTQSNRVIAQEPDHLALHFDLWLYYQQQPGAGLRPRASIRPTGHRTVKNELPYQVPGPLRPRAGLALLTLTPALQFLEQRMSRAVHTSGGVSITPAVCTGTGLGGERWPGGRGRVSQGRKWIEAAFFRSGNELPSGLNGPGSRFCSAALLCLSAPEAISGAGRFSPHDM